MAASSSSIQQKYDVFISFRGIDTRDNFTSHLYADLCRKKIHTFIDNELERGDVVSDALLKTISESKISVVIFSENYASSKWCLDEIVKIMDCKEENGQTVIPVFFKVDPSHVRHQSGPFQQALARHGGHPKVQTWRDVLTEAANLSGWDSQVIRPEAKLVENIVKDIMGKLKLYRTSSRNFGNDMVGMSSHCEQIESLLGMINEDVRIIGLWGMGGIGKTTIATQFFNHFSHQFEGHYIIEDIRETCEKRGLTELREKLVTGLMKDGNLNIGTPNIEIPFIRDRLRRMKVLIVLDDVSDFHHLKLLDGWHDSLGPGSIVMITSRDKQLLMNGSVDRIYEVPELNYNDSLCLFSRHAFKQEHPPEDHDMRLTKRAINYAKGHPLALRILGSHLCGKCTQYHESALRKLERTPETYLQKVLRISYDGLDDEGKDLFLNIACLFKGARVNDVVWFHDARNCSPDIGLDVLKDKSLITVQAGGIWMHDLLQEMGRQIVREESIKKPGKRSRLCDQDDVCDVLTKNTNLVHLKEIDLSWSEKLIEIPDLLLATSLERLDLSCCYHVNKFPEVSSLKIQYLYIGETAIEEVPTTICNLKSLVTLGLHNFFSRNYELKLKPLEGLDIPLKKREHRQQVNIHSRELTDCLASLSALTYLYLAGDNFQEISVAIKQLTNLRYLGLQHCRRLQSLPQLPMNIKKVDATNCVSLEMVASPLSIAASEVFDSEDDEDEILFDFTSCWKLNQNARNNIVANAESRLLHRNTNYPENIEDTYYDGEGTSTYPGYIEGTYYGAAATIIFPGGDVPDWFKYKSRGPSLTIKLPPDWCNAELLCLVFCVVVEIKHCEYLEYRHNFHIRTNGVDRFHGRGGKFRVYFSREDIRSNQVILVYHEKLVNDWRKIPKGADDADEISIEFVTKFGITLKRCGVHLLYTRDIEDRCRRSVVQPNSPCGDLTQLSLKQDFVDDVEESILIHDAEDSEGHNDNSCNGGNLREDSASILRRKKMKWKLNTFNFTKFLRIRRNQLEKFRETILRSKSLGSVFSYSPHDRKLVQLQRGRKGENKQTLSLSIHDERRIALLTRLRRMVPIRISC